MQFYRYQGTKDLEKKSRYVDLELLQEDMEEYKDCFDTEAKLLEHLFNKYQTSLNLRDGISASELFDRVVNSTSHEEVEELNYNHPLTGLFGEEATEIDASYSLEELMKECPWKCEDDQYLVLYEGEKITTFGDDGVLFEPTSIIFVWERNKERNLENNLTTKGDGVNMMENVLKKTHFKIEAGYVWGEGHTEENSERFNEEVSRIFEALGFEVQESKRSFICNKVFRGKENLYCHPMDISGSVYEESIPAIEEALKNSSVIQFRITNIHADIYDFTEEEALEKLENEHKQSTTERILKMCRTTRRNKFVTVGYVGSSPVRTLDELVGITAYRKFTDKVIEELLEQGLLVPMNEDKTYYRTLNKTEMKAWERKNGKLQLEAV